MIPHGEKTGAALATTILGNASARLYADCMAIRHNPKRCYCEVCAAYHLSAELYRNMLRLEMEEEAHAVRTAH